MEKKLLCRHPLSDIFPSLETVQYWTFMRQVAPHSLHTLGPPVASKGSKYKVNRSPGKYVTILAQMLMAMCNGP